MPLLPETIPGEGLLKKLWDTLANKGVGGLLKPWQIRREGRAHIQVKSEEILLLAQAKKNAQEILSGELILESTQSSPFKIAKPSNPGINPIDIESALGTVQREVLADAVRKEINIAKALLQAEEELGQDPQPAPEADITDDWFFRWRDNAGQVSSDELQNLWGRLLAGEVKNPGTFSFRLLDFLHNLSPKEAQEISLISPYILCETALYRENQNLLEKNGVTFDLLLNIQHLGIITGVGGIDLNTTWQRGETKDYQAIIWSGNRCLSVQHDNPEQVLILPTYPLTPLGKEILKLIKSEPNLEYLRDIGLKLKTKDYIVKLASCKRISDSQIQVLEQEDL